MNQHDIDTQILDEETIQFLHMLPKVELHVHLEGAIPYPSMLELVQLPLTWPNLPVRSLSFLLIHASILLEALLLAAN